MRLLYILKEKPQKKHIVILFLFILFLCVLLTIPKESGFSATQDFSFRIIVLVSVIVTLSYGFLLCLQFYFSAKENKQLKKELEFLSIKTENQKNLIHKLKYQNPVTDIDNKAALLKAIKRTLLFENNAHHNCALFILNINNFKGVNEIYGVETGDKTLSKFGHSLLKQIAPLKENIEYLHLFHIYSDEFAILVKTKKNACEIKSLANKFLTYSQKPIIVKGVCITPSVRLGFCTTSTKQTISESVLFLNASMALHYAKKDKQNIFEYSKSIINDLVKKDKIENAIKNALIKNEFSLFLQPKYSVKSKKFTRFEALIRWLPNAENEKLLESEQRNPDVFISIAEETDLIIEIGDWVLNETCFLIQQLNYLKNSELKVSFNASIKQLAERDFVQKVKKAISKHNIKAECLEVEITESSFSSDIGQIVSNLTQLKKIGVEIALDDFGTGYSSLGYIQQFPLDSIKLDRSFVNKAVHCKTNREIISSVVRIAKTLGIQTVAEGVENEDEVILMTELGVDQLQGYYFYQALPLSWIESKMKRNNL